MIVARDGGDGYCALEEEQNLKNTNQNGQAGSSRRNKANATMKESLLDTTNSVKAKSISGRPEGPYENVNVTPEKGLLISLAPGNIMTVDALLRHAVKEYGSREYLGTRELLAEAQEKQANGKMFVKGAYGEYRWMSFAEVDRRIEAIGRALIAKEGFVSAESRVGIFCETQADWMLTAQMAFRFNFPVVTLYATLGKEALKGALQESELAVLVIDVASFKTLAGVIGDLPALKTIILLPHQPAATSIPVPSASSLPPEVTLLKMAELEETGKTLLSKEEEVKERIFIQAPGPDSLAVIMYTSGSTGKAKGVMITHRNLIAGVAGITAVLPPLYPSDIYIAYLPLAHVLELSAELSMLAMGCRVGYSSAQTITDKSSRIQMGGKGDMSVLRPTLFATVPIIMDRFKKTIEENVRKASMPKRLLFQKALEYKLARDDKMKKFPRLDALVFKKLRSAVGGRVRFMLVGGAPLSESSQRFIRACFSCPVVIGYGLTETCGAGSIGHALDTGVGHAGPPLPSCHYRLLDWPEGGYTVTDVPHPRGELAISGGHVSLGYFKRPEETDAAYVTLEDGQRWFKTGDIAEALPGGNFRIIDRKKDLVKLSHGEYISLGKIEVALKTHPLVDNAAIYADPQQSATVCLIIPNPERLHSFAVSIKGGDGGGGGPSLEDLCSDPEVQSKFASELTSYLAAPPSCLSKYEMPLGFHLCADTWLPGSDFLTDSMKLRRANIYKAYGHIFSSMYKD